MMHILNLLRRRRRPDPAPAPPPDPVSRLSRLDLFALFFGRP